MTALGTLLIQARASTSTTSVPSTLRFQQRHSAAVLHPHRRFPSMSKALVHELDRKMQQMREYALVTHGYHNENFQYPVHVRRSHDGEKPHRTFPSNHSRLSRGHRLLKSPRLSSSAEETPSTTTTNHCPNHSNSNSKAKRSQKSSDLQHSIAQTTQTFVVPPNKTVNDIDPALLRDQSSYTTGPALTRLYLHRKSSSSSLTSSPNFNASRPHSIACLSTTETIASNTSDSNESCTTTTITSDTTLITMDNPDEPSSPLFNSSPSSSQSILNQSTGRTPIRTMTQKFFSKLFHHPSKS